MNAKEIPGAFCAQVLDLDCVLGSTCGVCPFEGDCHSLRMEDPMADEKGYRTIHVACGQIVCRAGDVEHNLDQMEQMAVEAAEAGARVILFAEAAITGYLLTDEVKGKALRADGEEARRLSGIAAENDIVLAAGTFERSAQGLHVSHFIAFPQGRLIVQRKHSITPKEKDAGIVAGVEERILFEVDGVKFAVCICADSGIPDIYNRLARRGCQVLLLGTAGGAGREHMCHAQDLEDAKRRKEYIAAMEKVCFVGGAIEKCIEHHMAFLATNLSGDDGVSNYHPGHSSIIDSRGKLVALIPGEYVAEYLRPRWVHGEVAVSEPRTAC